jgi:hypothetical protein
MEDDKARPYAINDAKTLTALLATHLTPHYSSDVQAFEDGCPVSVPAIKRCRVLVTSVHDKHVLPGRPRGETLKAAYCAYIAKPMEYGGIKRRYEEVLEGAQRLRVLKIRVTDELISEAGRLSVLSSIKTNPAVQAWCVGDNIRRLDTLPATVVFTELVNYKRKFQDVVPESQVDSAGARKAVKTAVGAAVLAT